MIGIALAGPALLAAAACGGAGNRFSSVKAAPADGVNVALMSPSGTPSDSADMAALKNAATVATSKVHGSTVLSVQAENNGEIWEVQLAGPDGTEHLMEVDASGKVISGPRAKDTGPAEKARVTGLVKDAKVTFQEATEKVSAAVPGGKITHMSLDKYNDSLLVWDVDVVTPDGAWQALKIDAKDGTVSKNS